MYTCTSIIEFSIPYTEASKTNYICWICFQMLTRPLDYHSQQPKGFAFVEFGSHDQAREARDEMDKFIMKGRMLEVVFAQERRKTPVEMKGRVGSQQGHDSPGRGDGPRGRREYDGHRGDSPRRW